MSEVPLVLTLRVHPCAGAGEFLAASRTRPAFSQAYASHLSLSHTLSPSITTVCISESVSVCLSLSLVQGLVNSSRLTDPGAVSVFDVPVTAGPRDQVHNTAIIPIHFYFRRQVNRFHLEMTRFLQKCFRGGLVFKDHRLLHHSILGRRVMQQKRRLRRRLGL